MFLMRTSNTSAFKKEKIEDCGFQFYSEIKSPEVYGNKKYIYLF